MVDLETWVSSILSFSLLICMQGCSAKKLGFSFYLFLGGVESVLICNGILVSLHMLFFWCGSFSVCIWMQALRGKYWIFYCYFFDRDCLDWMNLGVLFDLGNWVIFLSMFLDVGRSLFWILMHGFSGSFFFLMHVFSFSFFLS